MTTSPRRASLSRTLLAVAVAAAIGIGSAYGQNADLQDINRLLKAGQAQQALDRVNTYLSTKPKDAAARFIRGLAQAELGKTNDAIMTFQSLTEDYPELPEPYNNLAVLYSSKGQFEKARVALELAIQTHPSYSTAHENLGDIYAKLASQAYDRALQLDKGNGGVATKLNLVRDLFSTNPKAITAPRAPAPTLVAAAPTAAAPVAKAPVQAPVPVTPPPAAVAKAPAAAPVAPPPPPPPAPVVAAPAPSAKPPAPAPAVAPAPTQDASADVQAAVNKWARDWANRNPDAYLAAYSKSFRPEDGTARSAWAETRRERLTTPRNIKVELLGTTVEMTSPTEAKVTFRQAYSSDALHTKTRKTLTLVKEGQRWLISRERVG
ncbi:MAG: tetratricopeptide repeat protein [Burkholderiales bacterium]|nr:tetratricopeptide repeat protein [Burkholderiales bacterium]